MARVYYLRSVLEHVIDGFDDVPFAQHHPVIERHQLVFHVHPQPGHQLDAVFKEKVEELLRYVPLVGEQLAVQTFGQHLEHFRVLVTDIGACKHKGDDLPSVIACQMKFEAMTPPHGSLAVCGDALEHFVGVTPEVVAYGYHGRINESDACTPAEGTEVQEEHEREKHTAFQFNKPVV